MLEKASAVGAHSLSGAVLEPGPLEALLPEWGSDYPGMKVPATEDDFRILTRGGSFKPVPDFAVKLLPRSMTYSTPFNNHGNFIISLGQLTPWLAQKAEGARASRSSRASPPPPPSTTTHGAVDGRADRRHGARSGRPARARTSPPASRSTRALTVLAEGCARLDRQAADREVRARAGALPADLRARLQGAVAAARRARDARGASSMRSAGRPTPHTYAGSFLYHLDNDRVYVGYIVGLDYQDPRLAPFEAFQQYKNHPSVKALLEGGEILSAGARTIAAGGWQSTPTLEMPGAILIGDAGGTLNFAKIKGVHQAIRSGDARRRAHRHDRRWQRASMRKWRASAGRPGAQEGPQLQARVQARHVARARSTPRWETLTAGKSPWTLKNTADWSRARASSMSSPRPTGTGWSARLPPRDRVSFVFFAGNAHDENQPVHLKVADTSICADRCAKEFGNPCERFCPAGVYEMVDDGARRPAPADQRGQLRALQGLRHQGSVPDHHLDHARGRLGSELPVAVAAPVARQPHVATLAPLRRDASPTRT